MMTSSLRGCVQGDTAAATVSAEGAAPGDRVAPPAADVGTALDGVAGFAGFAGDEVAAAPGPPALHATRVRSAVARQVARARAWAN
jgi:hypothetical protein